MLLYGILSSYRSSMVEAFKTGSSMEGIILVLADVLGQADTEAAGRNHQGHLRGAGVRHLIPLHILKAVGSEKSIGIIEITHVHANGGSVLGHLIHLRHIHAKAVGILFIIVLFPAFYSASTGMLSIILLA